MRRLLLIFCLLPILTIAQIQKVAILETVDREGNIPYAYKLMLRSNLAKAITNAPGYEAYDRTDMDAIMGEQNFQRTGLVSDDQIKRLGVMTGATYILVAEAVKVDEQNLFITAKILNVETAKTEMTDNALMGISSNDIQHGCESLANKLLGLGSATVNPTSAQKQLKQEEEERRNEKIAKNNPVAKSDVKVGMLLNFNDGSQGVVFYATDDGHGLAVSLDEVELKWENALNSSQCIDIRDLTNVERVTKELTFQLGKQNTEVIILELGVQMAPAAEWCTQHGDGWYLPSAGELWYMFWEANGLSSFVPAGAKGAAAKVRDEWIVSGPISSAILRAGGKPFSNHKYWTSTENDNDDVFTVKGSGQIGQSEKPDFELVRAVRAF